MKAFRLGDAEHFIDRRLDQALGIFAGKDLSVGNMAKSGKGVQGAIPNQLRPEFTFDVVGNAARNARRVKECSERFGFFISGAEHEITSAKMLDASWGRDCRGDVDDRGESFPAGGGADLLGVINAILQTDDGCLRGK